MSQFNDFQEDFQSQVKEERVINDLLRAMPEANKYDVSDVERVLDSKERNFQTDFRLLQDFASDVKQELQMANQCF